MKSRRPLNSAVGHLALTLELAVDRRVIPIEVMMKRTTIFAVTLATTLMLTLFAFGSPLHHWRQQTFCRAAWLGETNTMRMLLAFGANVSECSPAYVNPLSAASESGNRDAIQLLLKYGANVNQRDKHGWTPLMYAAGAGQASSVRFLISQGADVNVIGSFGSASRVAALANHHDVVSILRNSGATR